MSVFIYTGNPTYGKTTIDLKVPSTGGFHIYYNITPNVTEISTSDVREISYFTRNTKSFTQIS